MKWYFYLLIGLGVIALGLGAFFVVTKGRKSTNKLAQETTTPDTTKQTKTIFTSKMFDTEKIKNIGPLGELNGGFEEVQTLNGLLIDIKPEAIKTAPLEVYAPADMELFTYAHFSTDDRPEGDWALEFRINNNLDLTIHHLNNASQKIVDAVGNAMTKNDSRGISVRKPIKIKAGEIVGTTKGTSLANNWNIYLYDKTVRNQFINEKRFEEDENLGNRFLNATCLFDYYDDATTKDSLYALLGASAPGQTKSCGSPSKDVRGTLSGLWHLKQQGIEASYEGDYGTPLSIYKRSDDVVVIFELGKSDYRIETDNASYKKPEEITTSHCYRLTDIQNKRISKGYAYFKIDSDMEMSTVYSATGDCPAEFPTGSAKKYYR